MTYKFIDEEAKLQRIISFKLATHNEAFGTIEGLRNQLASYNGNAFNDTICEKNNLPSGTKGAIVFYMIHNPTGTFEHSFSIEKEIFLLDETSETDD